MFHEDLLDFCYRIGLLLESGGTLVNNRGVGCTMRVWERLLSSMRLAGSGPTQTLVGEHAVGAVRYIASLPEHAKYGYW